ncbi:unnamed protein product [Victoria cruziana]
MPMKWILYWQSNSGTALNSQILAEVYQCLEGMGATKGGRWKTSITLYRVLLRDQNVAAEFARDFLGISLNEQPNKHYFILRGSRIVVEADSTILTIMEKLQSYRSRLSLFFEGIQYQIGDFQLRVGKVVISQSESLKGIVMEVEYTPISSVEKSQQIMEEFLDLWQEALSKKSLPGHFVHNEASFIDYGLEDRYTSQHTAVEYVLVMGHLISQVRP